MRVTCILLLPRFASPSQLISIVADEHDAGVMTYLEEQQDQTFVLRAKGFEDFTLSWQWRASAMSEVQCIFDLGAGRSEMGVSRPLWFHSITSSARIIS